MLLNTRLSVLLLCFGFLFFEEIPCAAPRALSRGQISQWLMVIGVIGCCALTYINSYKSQVRSRCSEHGIRANIRANVRANVCPNVRAPDEDPENLISGPIFEFKHSHNLAGSSAWPERGSQKYTPLMCPPEFSFL